jgi:hypothetical protein
MRYFGRMYLPKSPLGKTLAFVALLAVAMLVGSLLGKYRVSEDKLQWGGLIPFALYLGIQLKTGLLVIGRSWNTAIATRDKRPRIYWTVLGVESVLFLLVVLRLTTATRALR